MLPCRKILLLRIHDSYEAVQAGVSKMTAEVEETNEWNCAEEMDDITERILVNFRRNGLKRLSQEQIRNIEKVNNYVNTVCDVAVLRAKETGSSIKVIRGLETRLSLYI